MDNFQKKKALNLLQSVGGKTLLETAASYTVAIFFGQSKDRSTINNGTMFFADFGQGILGITAAHIYEAYIEKKDTPNFICQVGGERFDPEANLIDVNYYLDIATFRISLSMVTSLNKQVHSPLDWPAKFTPKEGDDVFLAGYPAVYRENSGHNNVIFGATMHMLTIDSINDRYMRCAYSETIDVTLYTDAKPNIFYGGVSGAPLLLIHTSPVVHWFLCGVVYQSSSEYEILLATHAHYIHESGVINSMHEY